MERAVEIEPNDARLQADLALFLHAAGREEEARAAIEAAETLDPEDENVERARRVIAGD
jgi:Flp pilus assembly protein TadD